MKRKTILTIPLAILAILAVGAFAAPTVQAHDGVASGTCNGGVSWDYHNYDKTVVNSITVTIDGVVRYTDGDFKASDTGTIATDKTVAHTWTVDVNAPGGQYDKHPSGSYAACVIAPTTTAAPTTTTVAETTTLPCQEDQPCWDCATMGNQICGPTTTVVAVGEPPVPSSVALAPPVTIAAGVAEEPVLPRTGLDGTIVGLAALLVIVGTFLVLRGRRVR